MSAAGLIGPSSLGSVILLTPLGRKNSSINAANDPFCYLLEIDQAKILLDCGATLTRDHLDVEHLLTLKEFVIIFYL